MDSGDFKVLIYIFVALAWAANAVWQKRQERKAAERALRAPRPAQPAAPARPLVTAEGRRYQEVQEEIRRKIAEKWQAPAPARKAPPVTRASTQPPSRVPARQMAAPPVVRVEPTSDMASPFAVATSGIAAYMPESAASAYAVAGPGSAAAAAYTLAGPVPATVLQAALANPNALRQAFLFREILDRPLCLRPAGCGGHENWN